MRYPLTKVRNVSMSAIALGSLTGCWGQSDVPTSDTRTVHIQQTAVKNQYRSGFCWSYTISALLESLEEKKGTTLDLSEEYLAFYHLKTQLTDALNADDPKAELSRISEGFHTLKAFKLADKVGMVPEGVFSYKLETNELAGIDKKLKAFFTKVADDKELLASYRSDQKKLDKKFAEIFGAIAPKPTDKFEFEGKEYTAVSFMKDRLEARSSDYERVDIDQDNWENTIHRIKTSMMNKVSVPISVRVFKGISKAQKGVWDWSNCPTEGCATSGAHAVLAVDFVTEGGRGGEMPMSEVKDVFHNPLDELIIKNSWGQAGVNQQGEAAETDKGYYVFKSNFLKESIHSYPTYVLLRKELADSDIKYMETGLIGGIVSDGGVASGTVMPSQKPEFTAALFDVPNSESANSVSYSWELTQNGKIVDSAPKGAKYSMRAVSPGTYDLTLTTSLGEHTHTATRHLWVLDDSVSNVFDFDGTFATTNMAAIKTKGSKKILELDTTNGQPVADNNQSIVNLPDVGMQQDGKILITYSVKKKKTAFDPQIALGDGEFEKIACSNKPDLKIKDTYNYKCLYPARIGGYNGNADTAKLRLVFNQMPQEKYKFKGITALTNMSVSLVNADLSSASGRVYATAKYPKDTTEKHFSHIGTDTVLTGVFGKNVDEVAVYSNDELIETISKSDMSSSSGSLVAAYTHSGNSEGYSAIKMVAVVGGFETSYVPYQVFVTSSSSVSGTNSTSFDLTRISPFTSDTNWDVGPDGISPQPGADQAARVELKNKMSASVAVGLDLAVSHNTALEMDAIYNLEKDFDFMFVKVSSDGGKSFDTLSKLTDGGEGLIKADLSKYDGKKIILRVDVVTDLGAESKALILKTLDISSN